MWLIAYCFALFIANRLLLCVVVVLRKHLRTTMTRAAQVSRKVKGLKLMQLRSLQTRSSSGGRQLDESARTPSFDKSHWTCWFSQRLCRMHVTQFTERIAFDSVLLLHIEWRTVRPDYWLSISICMLDGSKLYNQANIRLRCAFKISIRCMCRFAGNCSLDTLYHPTSFYWVDHSRKPIFYWLYNIVPIWTLQNWNKCASALIDCRNLEFPESHSMVRRCS